MNLRRKVRQSEGTGITIRIKARTNESLEGMLRRFKKVCEKEGLTRDIKRTAFYEKPSEVRRRKARQLVRKIQKEARRSP
ncbi:MAG: 30S ribosomal protein S21 [Planctomycetota bacterium]|jgi:small subunit ribosomal protein S21